MIQRWAGKTVAVLASGPSMSQSVAHAIRKAGLPSIAINNTFRLAPHADVLYACDGKWWDRYFFDANLCSDSEFWSQDKAACAKYPIHSIESAAKAGLSKVDGVIHQGGNSGYQAIGLAHQFGAAKILLFGYDMGEQGHWHGDHELGLYERMPFDEWLPRFEPLARDLKEAGVEVVNCNPDSRLLAFPFQEYHA